jgi:fucose 4-O-acetylase-like acetyltransferase
MNKAHTSWVDYAKGIGILLVIYGHVSDGLFRAGLPFSRDAFQIPYDVIYTFHMPLFFFLSGLFFPQSWQKRGTGGLIRSKVDTVVYPYLLWSVVQGLIEVALSRHTNHHTTFGEVASLLWHPRQQFWFLYALFVVFVLAALLYEWLGPKLQPAILIACAIAFAVRSHVPHIVPFYYLAANAIFFFVGAAAAKLASVEDRPSTPVVIGSLMLFAGCQFALWAWGIPLAPVFRDIFTLVVAVISIGVVVVLSLRLAHSGWRWLQLLGEYSLAIFLMHTIFASGVRMILQRVFGIENVPLHLILGVAAGAIGPMLVAGFARRRKIDGILVAPRKLRLAG